jgi:DNA-binding NtrC family response regulator
MAAYVLIVDDDPAECRHVEEIVRSQGHLADRALSGEAALARLARADMPPVSAVILDLVMPDLDGMAVLERLARHSFPVPVIVQTALGGADAGAAALRAGAFDFFVKPASPERVRVSLANALRIGALESEILRMRLSRSGSLGLRDIVMHSVSMERVHRLAERAARCPTPVLIEGERGVGKELLARAIHGSSARRSKPFVAVNCGGVLDSEFDSLLFGASGNESSTGGKMREANGGTLFLEEIGALPIDAQRRLAHFLATREADTLMDGRSQRGDVRLIAATSRRLIDSVFEDGFLEELFYRMNVLPIWLPPLRERRADIPALARSFLARLATEAGRSFVTGFSTVAMDLLVADDWPGNVHELEHAVVRAVMLAESGELTPREFPSIVARAANANADRSLAAANGMQPISTVAVQEQVVGERSTGSAPRADMRTPPRYGVARLLDDRGELRPFEVLEEEVIRFAIDHYSGRMSEVARRLGIGRSTLYRKVKDYGIAAAEPVAP